MTTHVFIVDSTTFKYHLEFLFAGTGAKEDFIDFNDSQNTILGGGTENKLTSMIADASRIREGDLILFYLQQNYSENIYEGKFYGVFKATQNWSFLDNNDDKQFLKDKLKKSLTFRTLIKPHKVYSEGVTEWEALDEIKNIVSPNQMLWSLIYRKLKGNRGNTMITIYESERICQLIRNKNSQTTLDCKNKFVSYDFETQKIIIKDKIVNSYDGRSEEINILPRLIQKFKDKKAFEAHLQAYIVKNIGLNKNQSLDKLIISDGSIEWIGNEVSVGVGMQRIDIMLSLIQNEQKICMPIELKAVEATIQNAIQIQRYIDWIEQYYIPNRQSDIQPILLTKKTENKATSEYKKVISSFNAFNKRNTKRCNKLKYIEFELDDNKLLFNEITY